MAFATGEICKTIAMVAKLTSPYLTEGATKIAEGEIKGKRVGGTYKFSYDKADIGFNSNGMNTSWSNSGAVTSETEEIKIANASAKVANGALDKNLSAGDWEQFCKQTGVDVANRMVKETALADMGKAGEVVVCGGSYPVNALASKALVMNKFGQSVRAYGSWNGIGAILGSSKVNAPCITDDKYENGTAWKWGNFASMRGIDLPTIDCSASASSGLSACGITTAGVFSCTGTPTAGTAVKVEGRYVYFPDTTASHAIVIGAKPSSDLTGKSVDTTETGVYEPIIVRADGAQGAVDASSLIEAKDSVENFEGVGIAHTEEKNAQRGLDHYFDMAGAFGVARKEGVKVYLLKV